MNTRNIPIGRLLGYFALVVLTLGIIGFGIHWYVVTHTEKATAPCVVRLIAIDGFKTEWALEHNKTTNDIPTWGDLRPYLPDEWTNRDWTNGRPICPDGGTYSLGRVGKPPTCSIGGPYHSVP